MDYGKMYKEALERVRRLHDRMLVLSSTDALVASSELEFIFPELAKIEDERIRKGMIHFLESEQAEGIFTYEARQSWIAYLEKQKEQKQDWSEEDEKRVKQLIYDTEHIRAEYEKRKKELGESFNDELIKDCDDQIAWLKSLRPSWKPSEEQMKALEAATVRYQSTGLESLYEELKKL